MRAFLRSSRVVASAVVLSAASGAAQQPVRQQLRGPEVRVYNVAGSLQVEGGAGDGVVVEIRLAGADASQLRAVTDPIDGRETLRILYPEGDIIYPAMGPGSGTTMRIHEDGTFEERSGGPRLRSIRVRGAGAGVEAWADLKVIVPPGQRIALYLGVGKATVSNVDGDLVVDVSSADIDARRTRGRLRLDTGSGDIVLDGAEGDVTLDTGSGAIEARNVRGETLQLDTGSGDVRVAQADVGSLRIDTGSGDVDVSAARARTVGIDTGSGGVRLALLDDVESVGIDTGSGDVTLAVPPGLGAEIAIATSSGEIVLDVPIDARLADRTRLRGRLGDGRGQIVVDTASGDVRVLRTPS